MQRLPVPALRPFVATLWATTGDTHVRSACEHVLPTGRMHLAIRLGDAPLQLLDAGTGAVAVVGHAVVGGARDHYYLKHARTPSPTVGAQLHPGAALALFGMPADALAHRHVALEAVLGDGSAALRERLLQEPLPQRRIDILEAFLATRLPRARGLHPAVAESLALFASGHGVAAAVQRSGYSHRHFGALFANAVGLTPQRYRRVLRFQHALDAHRRDPAGPWARLAHDAGYSDQPHFVREFIAITGVRPQDYRRIAPAAAHHVPADAPWAVRPAGQVDSIQDARPA
ncbi:AraC family transcriptional regulator [Luteimonas yindakuii]|uniref:AraC family transcriptional regulator n=1 Tax=Luteimonas yindakuii TaxID=2565782 RepID=UPI0010A2AD08|nr:helix-turn-helix domain-containing protein [Luteimonas yindakuii]QCO68022.1 AraC family transcriptional regulator [Luteimonas yindakuii]